MVTVRVRHGLPSLRSRRFVRALRTSFRAMGERAGFRLVDYSIQRDHLHGIVEADDHALLANGMKSLVARVARAVNRVFGRQGRVMAGRYHVRWLRSPRAMRNALRYVLLNVRKHARARHGVAPLVRLDEASSGRFFEGWSEWPSGARPAADGTRDATHDATRETQSPRTWLRRVGWRRHGRINPADVPGGRPALAT